MTERKLRLWIKKWKSI